jgi:hypothetical protein
VDSQPKTQRSSREKTKCKHIVSNPNYSTGLDWKWGKYIESSPLYRGNLGFPLSSPLHGRASARPKARANALPRPHGPVAMRRVSTRGDGTARTRFLPRPRVKPRPWVNADARGRPNEKDVRTDIFIQKRPL